MAKKPLAALLISMKKKSEAPKEEMPEEPADDGEEGMDEGLTAAADEVMSAIDSGDAKALAGALRAFVEQC